MFEDQIELATQKSKETPCECVLVCGVAGKYTLFIMQEGRPHREGVGLFKRLAMACLLALALIPSHLSAFQDSHTIHIQSDLFY